MARLVGANGKVVCVDVQEKMLRLLRQRAEKAGLSDRIETRQSNSESFGFKDLFEKIDFALAFAVIHEIPNQSTFFQETYAALKPGARLLIAEPRGHVSEAVFGSSLLVAKESGFEPVEEPRIKWSHAALLQRLG